MQKKIVVASDSFKGSASSLEVGQYIADGVHALYPDDEVQIFSIADGGEGTVASVLNVVAGQQVTLEVEGPLGQPVSANYGIIDNGEVAVIEMAEASGITLVGENDLDIMNSSTIGTGQLILDAVGRGVKRIYIGIGGSATNDGGMGMASALGVKFLDETGQILTPISKNLSRVHQIDLTGLEPAVAQVEFIILSDVSNPLCGPNGASAVYGPQKGATPELVEVLDSGLAHFAQVVEAATGLDMKDAAGAGAAGGLGFGLLTFVKAKAQRGINTLLDLIDIEDAIKRADLVITGEGRLDGQSINGKAPIGIAEIANRYQVPTVAIVGSAETQLDAVYAAGIAGVFDIINRPMSLEEAISQTPDLVSHAAKNVMAFYHRLSK